MHPGYMITRQIAVSYMQTVLYDLDRWTDIQINY